MSVQRWSEDATVGKALIVAGAIILVVQVLPRGLFALLPKLWPLAIMAVGVALLLGGRKPR